jgi:hypothetical protein
MTILRQIYVESLLERFRASPALTTLARVERSVIDAMDLADRAVIVAHRSGERKREEYVGYVDRFCELLITIVTRDSQPDVLADQILEVAHPIVMGLTGHQLIDIEEMDDGTDPPVYAGNNGSLCLCTTHYLMHYRTQRDDLSK